jgi:glycosyltransferase involved in cell wall biosynthesis
MKIHSRRSVTPRHEPTFSVIIPAFNAAATIAPAIASVLRQTRADYEVIVIDDGSTDDTASKIQPFLKDPRVRMISQVNRGLSSARNVGVEQARGSHISLLDSDDLWMPDYLATMGGLLRDADDTVAGAYTDAWLLDDTTRRIARTPAMKRWHPARVPDHADQFLHTLLENGNYVFVGVTLRRAVLHEIGLFRTDLDASEDYELWLRLAAKGYRFIRSPRIVAIYRRSPRQMSADEKRMYGALAAVYRIVAEEYDVSEEIRELADRLMLEHEQRLGMLDVATERNKPRTPSRLRKAIATMRHFRKKPPPEVRRAFPDLRSL